MCLICKDIYIYIYIYIYFKQLKKHYSGTSCQRGMYVCIYMYLCMNSRFH